MAPVDLVITGIDINDDQFSFFSRLNQVAYFLIVDGLPFDAISLPRPTESLDKGSVLIRVPPCDAGPVLTIHPLPVRRIFETPDISGHFLTFSFHGGDGFLDNSAIFYHILPVWLIGKVGFLIFRLFSPSGLVGSRFDMRRVGGYLGK